MDRDKSIDEVGAKVLNIMVPAQSDVAMGKRVQITKSAKRFERYGNVADGQDLVRMVSEIAGSLAGKPSEVESARHKKKTSQGSAG